MDLGDPCPVQNPLTYSHNPPKPGGGGVIHKIIQSRPKTLDFFPANLASGQFGLTHSEPHPSGRPKPTHF